MKWQVVGNIAGRKGEDGKSAEPLNETALIDAILKRIELPKDGADGKAGEDADPKVIAALVRDEVAKMPTPKDGTSVTVSDVEPVVAAHVAKAIAALPTPKDGESVRIEQVQRMVEEVVAKAMATVQIPKDGEPGHEGRDGRDGPPGRDAAQIDILPSINEERSYARGTFASHKGGLWRAKRATEGMEGWECIVDGDHDDDVLLADDNRTFTFRKIKSSGRVIDKSFVLPVVLDCGIFKEGTEYLPGDGCTWGGSFWIAQKKTMSKPDSGDGAFRLAVKRGRDGKEGPTGKQGDKGLDGRAGRDLTQMMPSGVKY